jgi:hypothetical protein
MLDSFDTAAIPKTYADAITVTRQLGIQYLWIDSFCIIQDDREDWEREADRMGDIYEKAFLNIAATGAEDGNTGFLYNRRTEPMFVRVPADPKSENQFYFTNQPDSDFEGQVKSKRLTTRGWVMQERFLSRRTIHFSNDQWYWECGDHIISEDGWRHDFSPLKSNITPSLRASLEDSTMAIGKVFKSEENYTGDGQNGVPTPYTEVLWAQILRAYSNTELTFWSDKMPALQGLANRFSKLTGSTYLFGHWIKENISMPLSLMWYASQDGGIEMNNEHQTPSWSCLKGNGPVGFHDCRGATPTTMIDRIGSKHRNVLLRGRLREAKLSMPNGENPPARPTYYSMSFVNKTQYGSFTNTLGPARFDDADCVPKDFKLLLVFEKMPYGRYTNNQKDQLALVLQEVANEEAVGTQDLFPGKKDVKKYKRIGIANVNNHNFFSEIPFSEAVIV